MEIKVLGSGCKSCKVLYETVKDVVDENNITANVEYVTDLTKLVEFGIMSVPALVIDNKVITSGKSLSKSELIEIINGNNNDNQGVKTSCDCEGNC